MNLLDLMEDPEQAPPPAPNRPPRTCSCPDYYYPTHFVNTHVREDIYELLRKGNFRQLAELGIRFWHEKDRRWYTWTKKLHDDFVSTARRFPKCNRSKGERDP